MSKQKSKKPQVWTTENAKHIILLYERYPCLYDVKRPDYHNRNERQKALQEILREMNLVYPNLNLNTEQIKTKIHGIRSQYIGELNKIKKSQSTGVSPDDLYTPKLWCFEMLGFLSDSTTISCRGESNLNLDEVLKESQEYIEDSQQEDEFSEDVLLQETEEIEIIMDDDISDASNNFSPVSLPFLRPNPSHLSPQPSSSRQLDVTPRSQNTGPKSNKKRKKEEDDELKNLLKVTGQAIQSQAQVQVEGHADFFCQYLSSEMSKIDNEDILDDLKEEITSLLFRAKAKYKSTRK